MEDLLLMHKDEIIAKVISGKIETAEINRLPYILQRTARIETWLESRAIDSHRINSRLLKRVLKLSHKDDVSTVLSVNAATITDNYWVKPIGDKNTKYESIRFKENHFDKLALYGDPNAFSLKPGRTPELTNIGSYEKCWSLHNGEWWMYKTGNNNELFSELLIYKLGKELNYNMAEYIENEKYIKTRDFTNNASVDYEPIYSIVGENIEYKYVYDKLVEINPEIAEDYVKMCYFDGIFFNMDRHENNFGIIRDAETGKALSLAPLFDHNIALIARGLPKHTNDLLIDDFTELLHHTKKKMIINELDEQLIMKKINEVPFTPSCSEYTQSIEQYVAKYIIKRQEILMSKNVGFLSYNRQKR
jgi:hypothetical protein